MEDCAKCAISPQENARLLEKYAKLHEKYTKLKDQYESLCLRNQILEQQAKFLDPPKPREIQQSSEQMIPVSEVSHILEDFDSLLASQSEEISKLMDDRDKLSTICFQCLTVISKQGIPANTPQPTQQQPSTDLSEALSIIGIRSPDGDAITTIKQYVTQQKLKAEQLNTIIANQREKKRTLQAKLTSIYRAIRKDKEINSREAIAEIGKLKQSSTSSNALLNEIISVFEAFCNRFPTHHETKNCMSRIRSWLQDHNSKVDVVQEIDFLLGMCSILTSDIDSIYDIKQHKPRRYSGD